MSKILKLTVKEWAEKNRVSAMDVEKNGILVFASKKDAKRFASKMIIPNSKLRDEK
jgi:hypothetical protein